MESVGVRRWRRRGGEEEKRNCLRHKCQYECVCVCVRICNGHHHLSENANVTTVTMQLMFQRGPDGAAAPYRRQAHVNLHIDGLQFSAFMLFGS